jgi:ABC-2 type transport system permease protein
MRNAWTIAKREFNMYFASPVAYVVAFGILLVLGFWFFFFNFIAAAQMGQPPDATMTLRLFITLGFFFIPAVTMRLMSEEQRTGTLELLLTAPLREWELVLGKWLAALGFVSLLISLTVVYPLILNRYMTPGVDKGVLAAAYLGLWLIMGSMLAMGVFVSSLFANQIAAFFGIMALEILMWAIGGAADYAPAWLAEFLRQLDVSDRFYSNFHSGVVVLADLVYFASVIIFFLFLATRVVESRRWR